MSNETYYIVRVQARGWYGYEYLCYRERIEYPYGGSRAVPAKWGKTDDQSDAYRFETHGKAAQIAKRLGSLKDIVSGGGKWVICRISEEIVESSDESPPKKLARVGK